MFGSVLETGSYLLTDSGGYGLAEHAQARTGFGPYLGLLIRQCRYQVS